MANLGPPVVDGRGHASSSACELQRALFNEVLLAAQGADVETFVSPDRRLLGGGGIAEFFPTERRHARPPAVRATTRRRLHGRALQGAKAARRVFLAQQRAPR